MSAKPHIYSIPASVPFAEELARGVIARLGDDPLRLSEATIYLPTRRAVRTLSEAFARVLGGAALLPDIKPLGDVDEDDFLFDLSSDGFDLPPAIGPIRRRLLLAQLVLRWDAQRGGNLTFAQAAALGASLAGVMDEIETQGSNLDELETLVPGVLATHWAEVTQFLKIVRDHWPGVLEQEHAINPAAHRNAALRILAERFAKSQPEGPVIAAGSTGSIPATAELLKAIAHLPNGMVVLPGLDRTLNKKSWAELDPGHPQYGMAQLLVTLGASREEVVDWKESRDANREAFLSETLRPAPTTDAWRARAEAKDPAFSEALNDVTLLEAAHPAEEATAIAVALRQVLETPNTTAALITPDRGLARRVAAELGRWDIAIDDSAGRPLSRTPSGAFLCLLAEAADAKFAPVPLLALLKHPLAAHGEEAAEFRRKVRALDRLCLRGPRPDPGLAGIDDAIFRAHEDKHQKEKKTIAGLQSWFRGVAKTLQPLGDALNAQTADIAGVLEIHIAAAEKLAGDAQASGTARLWNGTDGEAAAKLVAALKEAARDVPPIEAGSYAPLFRLLADEKSVRPVFGTHPRLSILGPLEARLQSFDLVILGELNEGTWPRAAPIDPWFSRPMRKALGLEQPERAIGLAAHDFAMLAAAQNVILTRARKIDGTQTVASRWLQRMLQLANGLQIEIASGADIVRMAAQLTEVGKPTPAKQPRPTPPVAARPGKLSVTEIETWLRDPYAIYARHILKLDPLDPLDEDVGPLERGNAIHSALEIFVNDFPGELPEDAEERLIAISERMFAEQRVPQATLAVWRPRFATAARWFLARERDRRAVIVRSHTEKRGALMLPRGDGKFILSGVADRIDELEGGGAAIIDYKTGKSKSVKQVKAMLAPQLPLEAAMLRDGAFADIEKLAADLLIYMEVTGGKAGGKQVLIDGGQELADKALALLAQRIAAFDDEGRDYRSRAYPEKAKDYPGRYDHLARVREWSVSGWNEDDAE